MKYASELEARLDFVATAARYAGIAEGSAEHKELLKLYNEATEGYNMTAAAAWCAAFLSAVAAKLGYKKFPLECSCSRMLKKAEKLGIRVEGRGYRPQVGDWLVWDLDLNGAADHIGVVIGVEGDELWVLEGNYGDTVKARSRIRYDDPRVYRWICLDYGELVERTTASGGGSSGGKTAKLYDTIEELPEWAQEPVAELVADGIIEGIGDGALGMSLTEVRLAVWLWRGLRRDGASM